MASYHTPLEWKDSLEWLLAGLHGRSRWRLPLVISGLIFDQGRRVVAAWIRAAGLSDDYRDYYYFLLWGAEGVDKATAPAHLSPKKPSPLLPRSKCDYGSYAVADDSPSLECRLAISRLPGCRCSGIGPPSAAWPSDCLLASRNYPQPARPKC